MQRFFSRQFQQKIAETIEFYLERDFVAVFCPYVENDNGIIEQYKNDKRLVFSTA